MRAKLTVLQKKQKKQKNKEKTKIALKVFYLQNPDIWEVNGVLVM